MEEDGENEDAFRQILEAYSIESSYSNRTQDSSLPDLVEQTKPSKSDEKKLVTNKIP